MSRATNHLLRRNGRDQYGNKGNGLESYALSKSKEEEEIWKIRCKEADDHLYIKYSADWITMFDGLNKKELWSKLCPHGKPSLQTFYKQCSGRDSYNDLLRYLFLSNKYRALRILGVSFKDSREHLKSHNWSYAGVYEMN